MSILQLLLLFVIVFSGWPLGSFIASKTKEELKAGRKWFKIAMVLCFALILVSILALNGNEMILAVSSLAFMLMLFSAVLKKAG